MNKKPSDFLNNYLRFEPSKGQQRLFEHADQFLLTEEYPVMLMRGYAGTGKTTVLGAIVNILKYFDYRFVLLAPTGRAAKVMASYSDKKAYTIHKWIYRLVVDPDTGKAIFKKQKNYYKKAVFVVDEVSMITNENNYGRAGLLDDLFKHVFEKPENGNKLLMVGDAAQLPPVGYLKSPALDKIYLESQFGHRVIDGELTEVVRQDADSGVLFNATHVRQLIADQYNALNLNTKSYADVFRVDHARMEDGIRYAYDKVGSENTILICRSNKSANQYNQFIRRQIFFYEEEIEAGDVLMIAKNNYYWLDEDSPAGFLANGEFAEVTRVIDLEEKHGFRFARLGLQLVDYPDTASFEAMVILDSLYTQAPALKQEDNDRLYKSVAEEYGESDWKQLKNDPYLNALQIKFSYALTCHKAQGGQWEIVFLDQGFIPGDDINEDFLRWLYTAITRSTRELYFVNFNDKFF